jgi:hypothetical protein
MVGDWFEECFVYPLLQQVADRLKLYLDSRFRLRAARGERLVWRDKAGNAVDYDFVMEMDGTETTLGIPVAFIESFWRRGARHSKDKARDDSGKLLPMRDAYPTARFLGIVAGGDFTGPAKLLLQARGIDVLWIPKAKIVAAFEALRLVMDYPDSASEAAKVSVLRAFETKFTPKMRTKAAAKVRELVGQPTLDSYVARVRGALGALPQEIRFIERHSSAPAVFESVREASAFLENPAFDFGDPLQSFVYQITYSDGSEFERAVQSIEDLRALHGEIERLAQYVGALGLV